MATNVEVVKVSHDQLKRRVETSKKAAGHNDQTGKTDSQLVAEKEEKHSTKSRSTKARKEKDQRKPDQQFYRPGKSRMARNSSSAGSDLNSSRDESPTKPLQTPVNSKEAGSKGDQVSPVGEESLSKDLSDQVEADHGAVRSKNRGHQRYEADKLQRGDRSGGRHGRMDRKEDSGNNHTKGGSRPKDKQKPLQQRPARQESPKISDIGKTGPEGDDRGHEETWEIKPEDWETDTKSHKIKSDGKSSEAISPPKHVQGGNSRENLPRHVQGRSRNESPSKQMQGRSSVESPPKHMQGRSGKGRHDEDVGHKERKQKIHEESKVSENKPQELESLMGSDWDKEFEQQVQAQHSPKKSTDPRRRDGTKQHETGERLPQNRSNQTSGQSNSSQDQGAKSGSKKGHSKMEMDTSHKEPKKDVVKLSRQNYASEIQKLRAKKEQMEKDGSGKDDFETMPSAKDLQITVKAVSGNDESSRVVQEKSSKSYSAGRAQQRMNSENSTRSEKLVMDHVLTLPGEWEDDVDDLNYHVESMVITNRKFRNKDFDDSGGFERHYEERRRPLNRDERFQNEDHGIGDRAFERKQDERNKPQTRNDRLLNRDHNEKGFERKHDERRRPTNRDEQQPIQHDHASKRYHSSNSNSEQKDQRSDRRYRDKEELHRSGNERWHMDKEESHRMGKERHEHRRCAADEKFEDDRHHHGGEPERHQKEQDHRRRYHSGGRKETTRTRDRVSVSSDDGPERQGRRRGSSEAEDSSTTHGGGILRLPGKVENENTQPQHGSYVPVYDQFYQPSEGHTDAAMTPEEPKAKSKGRTGDQSRLWDPSKPNQKPALQQHQVKHDELHFQDPEMDKRDFRGEGTPPAAQQELWNSYIPNYPPGFSGMMQPPYGYPSPPPGYPVPNPSSWANQVDGAQGYKLGHPPLPPPPMMPYAPPYGGHSYPLPPGMPYHPGYNNPPHAAMLQEHQSVNRQSAQKLLRDAARCETELYNALSHGISMRETLQQLLDKQQELEQLYEGIILLDLDLCNQYNVEQTLWKNSYYQLIEALRKAIQEQPNGDSYKEDLLDFMQHGTTFYEGLLNKLQSTYHFQLENRTGLDPLHEEPRRSIKLALLSAQRCMIALGDIARYKEQASETNNYGKARSWYMKAQHLAPRNGRPYNQLAILALYTRRKLDAVYFYVRSLAATNPFLTARESLMTLFEEVRRKVEHKEQEEMKARREMERRREQRRKRRRRPSHEENRGRKEIWVAHDGKMVGGEKMEEEEEEEDEMEKGENLAKLSAAELNKKFVLSFLNVHGKLFTKTGMEAFDHATEHLLREFKALLDHSPSAILSTRLIQLMAINMFAVANISPQGDSPSSADNRPLLLEQAIQLGLNMFALLCLRCCSLLQDHLDQQDTDQSVLSQDLHELLPGVKVYADWMMCHPKLWNPPPSCNTTSYSSSFDVWSAVAQFLNLVKRVAVPDVKFAVNNEEDSLEVLLPEDVALSGFVPLMALPLQPVFIQADTSKILANDRVRLDSLTMFGEYLSGQETPLISFSVKTDSYVSVAPKALPRRETEHSYLQAEDLERVDDDGDDDVIVMDSYSEDDVPQGDGTISRLRERRDSLEKQLRDRELRDAHIQAIVESHRSQRLLEIVIKPYFLVPDTNCFIDHLPAIQRLVTCQRYLMVIPLVVINELDGLARGSREGQYSDPHHAVKVQHGARYAVEYLEEEFANRNRYLRASTSKGSIMDNIRFRSEEAEWKGNNDDHILRCCMHYCSDNARQYMPADKDAPLQIEREVVLLTNDRNLRVKAIQQNVPVKDIILFVRWAKV